MGFIKMNLKVELAKENDIDGIEELYDKLHSHLESNTNYPGWRRGMYPTRAEAEKGVAEKTLYVAKNDNKIVGSIILNHEVQEAYSISEWSVKAEIEEILVVHTFAIHPQYIRCGVGKTLLNFSDKLAKEYNIKAIRLDVYEHNQPAINIYEKCGYKYIATVDLGLGCFGLDKFKLYEKLVVL